MKLNDLKVYLHTEFRSPPLKNIKKMSALNTIFLNLRSKVNVKMTQLPYQTLNNPEISMQTEIGIPI